MIRVVPVALVAPAAILALPGKPEPTVVVTAEAVAAALTRALKNNERSLATRVRAIAAGRE